MIIDAELEGAKRPDEEFLITWDFAEDLRTGDTLTSCEVTATDENGIDVTAAFLDDADFDPAGVAEVQVQGGTAGLDYVVRFEATTTDGDVFVRTYRVRVRA